MYVARVYGFGSKGWDEILDLGRVCLGEYVEARQPLLLFGRVPVV